MGALGKIPTRFRRREFPFMVPISLHGYPPPHSPFVGPCSFTPPWVASFVRFKPTMKSKGVSVAVLEEGTTTLDVPLRFSVLRLDLRSWGKEKGLFVRNQRVASFRFGEGQTAHLKPTRDTRGFGVGPCLKCGCATKNRNTQMGCPIGKWKHGCQNLRFAPPV